MLEAACHWALFRGVCSVRNGSTSRGHEIDVAISHYTLFQKLTHGVL